MKKFAVISKITIITNEIPTYLINKIIKTIQAIALLYEILFGVRINSI